MQRILKSIQRDSKNLLRQWKKRNIFSVDMILNLAVAFLYIAFNHNAFNDIMQVFVLRPVV